ncbi:MAG: hypothetical protein HY900_25000, partial [Deltaproteobacteria bacterium]|nr:hypothetical protein [Deltaproteobacteria bacterium]
RGFNLYQVVKPFLDEACNAHGVTVDSSVFDGRSFAVLYRREVAGSLTYRLPLMSDALTCTALGKAMLAFLPEDEQLRLLKGLPLEKKTEKTLLTQEEILADLRLTKARGYSLNNEEFFPGFIAIGAPIINTNTQAVVGAVCFDFPTAQYSIEHVEQIYSEHIVRLGRDVSSAIPY